jgi:hypothetical protein
VKRRRFFQGASAGMLATIAMGVATLVAIALHAWPLERPLATMMTQAILPTGVGVLWLYVLGGLGQLAYGALCGGLLAVLVERLTMSTALALGLLRWLTTQVVVLPVVGWEPFGLAASPSLALATVLPHLAFALSLGWLARDDADVVTGLPGHPRAARVRSRYRAARSVGRKR